MVRVLPAGPLKVTEGTFGIVSLPSWTTGLAIDSRSSMRAALDGFLPRPFVHSKSRAKPGRISDNSPETHASSCVTPEEHNGKLAASRGFPERLNSDYSETVWMFRGSRREIIDAQAGPQLRYSAVEGYCQLDAEACGGLLSRGEAPIDSTPS